MATAGDIGVLNRALGAAVADVVAALRAVDTGLGLPSFSTQLAALPLVSRWERWQARRLVDDVASIRRDAVMAALSRPPAGSGPPAGGGGGATESGPGVEAASAGVLLGGMGVGMAAGDRVRVWLAGRERRMARFQRLAGQVRASGTDAHSVAALAVRALGELVEPLQ